MTMDVKYWTEAKATGGGSAILPTPAIGAVGRGRCVTHRVTLQRLLQCFDGGLNGRVLRRPRPANDIRNRGVAKHHGQ